MNTRQKIKQAITALNRLKPCGIIMQGAIDDLEKKLLEFPAQVKAINAGESPDQSAADDYLDHLHNSY